MAHFPQPHPSQRAARKRASDDLSVRIVLEHGKRVEGKLQTISSTGGCVRLRAPVQRHAPAELSIGTKFGEVRAIAEMLTARRVNGQHAQGFRFVALSENDYNRLKRTLDRLSEA